MVQVAINIPDEPFLLISPVRPNDILAHLYPSDESYQLTDYYLVIEKDSKVMRKYEFSTHDVLEENVYVDLGVNPSSY